MLLQTEFAVLENAEAVRAEADGCLPNRERFAQYLTPSSVARLMASMIVNSPKEVRFLDPGAGTGILTAATVGTLCGLSKPPVRIAVTVFEIDNHLRHYLERTLMLCDELCDDRGVEFDVDLVGGDFISFACSFLRDDLFTGFSIPQFNICMMNPPYQKLPLNSTYASELQRVGINTANMYSAFVELATRLIEPGGQLVAITPRSFCNGTYFAPFRRNLLSSTVPTNLHLFESRTRAFEENSVLQENVILSCIKRVPKASDRVTITSSDGPELRDLATNTVELGRVVDPNDQEQVIHIEVSESASGITELMRALKCSLADLGLEVSTGPVVDFRLKDHLRNHASGNTAPLLYPAHFRKGTCEWPLDGRKPNAIEVNDETRRWLWPTGNYLVTKRFSSKEERKRVVASVLPEGQIRNELLGFENHLNVFHVAGSGVREISLLNGLCAYLNSTLVDSYFRMFSGHTQVNAGDLRRLPFPTRPQLRALGESYSPSLTQEELDLIVNSVLFEGDKTMAKKSHLAVNRAKMLASALRVLKELDFPREQQNERTAYSLLALAGLTPDKRWNEAAAVPLGITPIMEFTEKHYGRKYAPNTRETFRRFSVHQMVQARLLICNPDKPERPPNSPKTIYQLESDALHLLRHFDTPSWSEQLSKYRVRVKSLRDEYERARAKTRIQVNVSETQCISLSPGGQNVLVKTILDDFVPFFTPRGHVLYVGDTDQKFAHFDESELKRLGVTIDRHGKMPDVIVHFKRKNWLVLIEAVTSHGPISPKRRKELSELFSHSTAGLVYVTAFLDRRTLTRYIREISWATEVWVAESPTHLIHFNGDRFLGPYKD